jgi:2-iminoacetate synthase ThiH
MVANLYQYVSDHLSIIQVITTRSYDERLDTISAVRDAGISVCSGGILGLGETDQDRVGLIWEVSKQVSLFSDFHRALQLQSQHA